MYNDDNSNNEGLVPTQFNIVITFYTHSQSPWYLTPLRWKLSGLPPNYEIPITNCTNISPRTLALAHIYVHFMVWCWLSPLFCTYPSLYFIWNEKRSWGHEKFFILGHDFISHVCIAGIARALAGIKVINCVNRVCIVLIYNAAYDPLWHQSVQRKHIERNIRASFHHFLLSFTRFITTCHCSAEKITCVSHNFSFVLPASCWISEKSQKKYAGIWENFPALIGDAINALQLLHYRVKRYLQQPITIKYSPRS